MMMANEVQYGNARDALNSRQGLVVFRCATLRREKRLVGPEDVHHLGEDASHGQVEAHNAMTDKV